MNKNKITIDFINNILLESKTNTKLLSKEYINTKTNLKFKCGKCGKIFEKRWDNMYGRKKFLCQSCEKINNNHKKIDYNIAKKIIEEKGYKLIGKYKNSREKILVEDSFGYRGFISLYNIILNKHFSVFSSKFNLDNLIYNLNIYSINNNIKTKAIKFLGKDNNKQHWIEFQCSCGNLYKTTAELYTTQNVNRCQTCSKRESNNEFLLKKELKYLNIKYETQKTFENCINPNTNYKLRFDFYLPDYNIIIECDGIQHDKPTTFGKITKEHAKKIFHDLKFKDSIKDKYCEKNDIKIIRIKQKQFKNNEYKSIVRKIIMQ